MEKMNGLKKFFNTGTAEGELEFLDEAFIPLADYIDIIAVPIGNPRILVGKKGSGKSALLRFFSNQMVKADIPSLLLRPKDFQITSTGDMQSLGELTRAAERALVLAIGTKLGTGISGLTLTQDDKSLFSLAVSEGHKNPDAVQNLLAALAPVGKAFSNIDFMKMAATTIKINNVAIRSAIEKSLSKSGKIFYVLIDDTDQIASPDIPGHLNRIWAFILAARSLMEECPNIKIIISLRDEVWRRLSRDNAGQRDQVDHFRNLIYFLNPGDQDIINILERRFIVACISLGIKPGPNPYLIFFESNTVIVPTTDEEYRYWSDFISKRSRERPRDGIQLVSKLIDKAVSHKRDLIISKDAAEVMPTYSEERVDDLKREVDPECPQIKEVIRSFYDADYDVGSFTMSPESAKDFISKIPGRFSIKLFGKHLRQESNDDAFHLWRYLHEVGFINARITDSREKDGYRHISPQEDPELISPYRWNDMQNIAWEIHPAYRDFLIKIQKEKAFGFGLPKKPKKKH